MLGALTRGVLKTAPEPEMAEYIGHGNNPPRDRL
jgi:hypothetical protein